MEPRTTPYDMGGRQNSCRVLQPRCAKRQKKSCSDRIKWMFRKLKAAVLRSKIEVGEDYPEDTNVW